MANAEQLAILKQGVEVWNNWKAANPEILVYLAYEDLSGINLTGVDLCNADLRGANLERINLCNAKLINSNLDGTIINKSLLNSANLEGANLRMAYLNDADLSKANLGGTDFYGAYLHNTKLNKALLINSNLDDSKFDYSNLSDVILGKTIIRNLSLDNVYGLNSIQHFAPSTLDISVFQQTKTPLPKEFTRGCGWQDWQVKSMELQNPTLTPDQVVDVLYEVDRLRNGSPLQVHKLFISHSRKDAAFIDFIGKQLEQCNILYWLDVRDATAGPLEKQIDKAIRLNQTFLLVLSQHSCESDWVEWELEKARQLEKESGRHVICPIELDRSWENGNLSERIKLQIKKYNVLDFSQWQETTIFAKQFERLIKGLDLFYKPT